MKSVQQLIVLSISIFILTSCTNKNFKAMEISSKIGITEKSPETVPPSVDAGTNPSANEAMKQVQVVQQQLNQDTQYSLTADEASELEAQGIIDSKNDIKGWVK